MDKDSRLVRPVFLIEGGNYLMLEAGHNGHDREFSLVTLAAFDACPAFVIVRNEYGDKRRCPREALYINNHLSSQAQ
jgi:hypothetical protein